MRTAVRSTADNRRRTAFTLVEMLVVIAIIGVLVALLVPTINGVMVSQRNASTGIELQKLVSSIEAYKDKVGDYPPDFSNRSAVVAHMTKAYPRNTRNMAVWLLTTPATQAPPDLDPAEALVFWLSLTHKNVRDPIGGTGANEVYFEFDPNRLKDQDGDGWPEYYPAYGLDAPYVYFDGRILSAINSPATTTLPTFAYAWAVYPSPYNKTTPPPNVPERDPAKIPAMASSLFGVVRPYRSNLPVPASESTTWQASAVAARTQWMAPGKFQIICAGLDSHFGTPEPTTFFKSFPTMNYYSVTTEDRSFDDSNLANFSQLKTFIDSVP